MKLIKNLSTNKTPGPDGIYPRNARIFQYLQINVILHVNKLKNNSHKIISIDAEKASDKIQHSFMINILQKVGITAIHLNIIKAIYTKPIGKIILNGEKLKASPQKSGIRLGCPLAAFIQHSFGSSSHSNQRRKKRNQN